MIQFIQATQALAFGLGTTELLIILGILLFIFGASRIPELGRSLGSGIRGFQKAVKGDEEAKQLEDQPAEPAREPARREATVVDNAAPAPPAAAQPATTTAGATSAEPPATPGSSLEWPSQGPRS
jgi:sec-independent protein translocase protein TatA